MFIRLQRLFLFQSIPHLGFIIQRHNFLIFLIFVLVNMKPRLTDTFKYILQSSTSSRRRQDNTVVYRRKNPGVNCILLTLLLPQTAAEECYYLQKVQQNSSRLTSLGNGCTPGHFSIQQITRPMTMQFPTVSVPWLGSDT